MEKVYVHEIEVIHTKQTAITRKQIQHRMIKR